MSDGQSEEDSFCTDHEECDNEGWDVGHTLAEDGSLIPVNRCPKCGIRWDQYVLQQAFSSSSEG